MGSLTPDQIRRRQELTQKLSNRTLTQYEAEELKQLLEIEKAQATTLGDFLGVLAVGVLLALVLDYLFKDK